MRIQDTRQPAFDHLGTKTLDAVLVPPATDAWGQNTGEPSAQTTDARFSNMHGKLPSLSRA